MTFPQKGLYSFANSNPNFLKGKKALFHQFDTKEKVKILWESNIQECLCGGKPFLKLGTFEKGYVNIFVNKSDEIWFGDDVVEALFWGGNNLNEVLMKLLTKKYYE